MPAENFIKYQELRKRHPEFIFESYDFSVANEQINIVYAFRLDQKASFRPRLSIPLRGVFVPENVSADLLKTFIFHIGMIEMLSYWKATCSPRILVKPHFLVNDQVKWWKKLFYKGLGEFLYRNGIPATQDDFVEIISEGERPGISNGFEIQPRVMVPVGGGKDSAVTLEILKNDSMIVPFALNPRKAIWDSIAIAGFSEKDVAVAYRQLDPALLKMNDEGYLNGHTPFSALLAFVSVLMAALSGSGKIALSNESSANESTVRFTPVNHQYSKSFEFEKDFRDYFRKYMNQQLEYFSFLRPLNEMQITKMFSGFPGHHHSFRSCNAGSRSNTWCGACPKCLFTFIMLSAFMPDKKVTDIFGRDYYADETLIPVLEELIGLTPEKPFECVGTIDEVNAALVASISRRKADLPVLLRKYQETDKYQIYRDIPFEGLMNAIDDQHFLSDEYLNLLKNAL